MKILLINPSNPLFKENFSPFSINSLSLPVLASLTPSDFHVKILDEEMEEINFKEDVNLVGISFMTHQAPKAYEISERFRDKRIKTILGGIHPTVLPEEALAHADSICIGEAEEVWQEILDDLKMGKLKRIYKGNSYANLEGLPFPRLDLLKRESIFTPIYTSRGCPFRCEFCCVNKFYGSRFRLRPIEEVMEEIRFRKIEKMDKTGWLGSSSPIFVFLDDNICGKRDYAISLFKNLINFRVKWVAQTTLNIAKDEDLLKLMKESGCLSLAVGIESINQENLSSIKKYFLRVSDFSESIKKIKENGIHVILYFIFGFENDDESVFENTLQFLIKNNCPSAIFNILVPLPGTEIYKIMVKENRIIEKNWAKYTGEYVVFKPRLLSPEKLQEGFDFVRKEYKKIRKEVSWEA